MEFCEYSPKGGRGVSWRVSGEVSKRGEDWGHLIGEGPLEVAKSIW